MGHACHALSSKKQHLGLCCLPRWADYDSFAHCPSDPCVTAATLRAGLPCRNLRQRSDTGLLHTSIDYHSACALLPWLRAFAPSSAAAQLTLLNCWRMICPYLLFCPLGCLSRADGQDCGLNGTGLQLPGGIITARSSTCLQPCLGPLDYPSRLYSVITTHALLPHACHTTAAPGLSHHSFLLCHCPLPPHTPFLGPV